jgi:serine/threonine protein phosphatase PrpC
MVWPPAPTPSGPATLCCRRWQRTTRPVRCAANRLVRVVQEELCDALARGHTRGAATTLALAAFSCERCTVLHVGDSRVYRIAASGQWQQLTRDHTVLHRMFDEGEAEPGVDYATIYNMMDSCIVADGYESDFAIGCCSTQLEPGDALFLCTDGVHDTLEERLQSLHNRQADPLAQVQAWRSAVLRAGAPDNFSMVLVQRLE